MKERWKYYYYYCNKQHNIHHHNTAKICKQRQTQHNTTQAEAQAQFSVQSTRGENTLKILYVDIMTIP